MKEVKAAIKLASGNVKLASLLSPIIEAYLELEEKTLDLQIRLASESRALKKTKAQKSYKKMKRKKSVHRKENERLLKRFEKQPWKLPYKLLPPKAKKMWGEQIFEWDKRGKVPKYNKPFKSLSKDEQQELRLKFLKQSYSEWGATQEKEPKKMKMSKKTLNEITSISDNALNDAYGYGLSKPGTFGHNANQNSASFALEAIQSGETDLEAISEAVHKGWANAFNTFDDPIYKEKPEKRKARKELADTSYSDLSEEEKEKDRVVARAMLKWHESKKSNP